MRFYLVLVCLLSITTAYSIMSLMTTIARAMDGNFVPVSSFGSGGDFRFGNLWVEYSSNGENLSVVCSVDFPGKYTSVGEKDLRTLTFSDGNSVEFNMMRNQTVWIGEKHRVTFLGPFLSNEDLSLMRSHGDVKSKILSPEDLSAVLDKLRDTKEE